VQDVSEIEAGPLDGHDAQIVLDRAIIAGKNRRWSPAPTWCDCSADNADREEQDRVRQGNRPLASRL
jgi:hypothetical protein